VKAECDLCCTSANAVSIVKDVMKESGEIIFVPDKYLGDYVSTEAGCELIIWKGYCPTHAKILPEDIMAQKELHPEAVVLAHPECTPGVRNLAAKVLSTEAMCWYARDMKENEFIIGTEIGILHRIRKDNPGKVFYPASEKAVCPNMKKTTLEKVLWALEGMGPEITLPRETMAKAKQCIQKMLIYRA
jgi:quinolinate synthase